MFRIIITAFLFSTPFVSVADSLTDAVKNQSRPLEQRARDEYRNPQQTLRFFGVKPEMTVVEVWPGGGWYTNILAPLLKDNGTLYAAHFHVDDDSHEYFKKSLNKFSEKMKSNATYKDIKLTSFHPTKALDVAPEGSADMVLVFRSAHNWYMRHEDQGVKNAFATFHKALKKGGTLGIVAHRLPETSALTMQKDSGYMKQSYLVTLAEQAGFQLAATSEINANPLDKAHHPKGVWTLPPVMRLKDKEQEKYLTIGESDRMTLKFVKP